MANLKSQTPIKSGQISKVRAKESTIEYRPSEIEARWGKVWQEKKLFSPNLGEGKPFYNLMMFPYPSAEGLHVGNMYAFTGADVYGRFMRMKGYDVFEPIGLDGFGIHSENYAIKIGRHPKEHAKISQKNFYRQLSLIGNGFAWDHRLETYDPVYYRWTQWLFIQIFKKGLAYRKKAAVNWCSSCQTVLADEQIIEGACERCETKVELKKLEQWFFKITAYAEKLLAGIEKIDWPEKIKIAQRNWIGRTKGARIIFKINGAKESIEVFTTRPDTLYGATFIVLSPEHPIAALVKDGKVQEYIRQSAKKTDQDRMVLDREKTGVFSGLYAINPLNKEKLPVWIADYAVMGYGTGALFGDAHDKRDVEFAKKYGIPLKPTIITGNRKRDVQIMSLEECFTGYGTLVNSGDFSGLTSQEAGEKVILWLSNHGDGGPQTTYHLRDWLISRQRYWGPPIPMIYCKTCNWQPVPESELPVVLPDIKDFKPKGDGSTPLSNAPDSWKFTKCPMCGGKAQRELEVSDTFLDSSWYFLAYLHMKDGKWIAGNPFNAKILEKWLPVNAYIGGAEHAVLHLLYARFVWMVLSDCKFLPKELGDEPFPFLFSHGLIVKNGAKMSKSKGNVVIPDSYIKKYGADAVRSYLMFLGPYDMGGDFRDSGIEGMYRFLKRVWKLITVYAGLSSAGPAAPQSLRMMHKTIKKVTEDIESFRYNTAIASLMEWYNFLSKQKSIAQEEIKTFLLLFAPFAPHMTEELWQRTRVAPHFQSIHFHPWPSYDPKMIDAENATIVIQINGKTRSTCSLSRVACHVQQNVEELAKSSQRIQKYLQGKRIKRTIYIEGKIINFVLEI